MNATMTTDTKTTATDFDHESLKAWGRTLHSARRALLVEKTRAVGTILHSGAYQRALLDDRIARIDARINRVVLCALDNTED